MVMHGESSGTEPRGEQAALSPTALSQAALSDPSFKRVGHKGADAVVPGNTVASFVKAVEIGVEIVEFDVLRREDPDAPLVIAHDWAAAGAGTPLSLAEALDSFTRAPLDRVEIDCDLKLPGREAELVSALRERDLIERATVSTMYVESLIAIRGLEPRLRTGWSYPKVTRAWDRKPWAKPAVAAMLLAMRARLPALLRRRAPELGISSLWCFHLLITPAVVAAAHDVGIEVIAWTVDDPARIEALRAIGVDGICSNDPRLLANSVSGGAG